ncbi:hypothetical protein B0T11DRAFT_97546 [Plectosphaerella cucumerina]|uniref:C2H2-type domain-containing protein n=1 Tax=Plectosphaerella cucumerina TaxID=40658 RepID=A0A8K0TG04_9PEZI|nr:hypothetical protein B0T11DRAFT_97546 [Plectosphaerella cucumerina]
MMSVVYEPRNFMHDGVYPPIGDHDHDHNGDPRVQYASDVTDLSAYNLGGALSGDDGLTAEDLVTDAQISLATTAALASLPPSLAEALQAHNHEEPEPASVLAARTKCIAKPDREVHKQADGKFYCTFAGCIDEVQVFNRKCEWSKHMDKHERPYRCQAEGCEKLPGFTYSGGLLRHEREVHGKHGGPKNTVNCPHPNCKRHRGKGFSRQENLNEHLRRVHAPDSATPAGEDIVSSDADADSERAGSKRKRSRRSSDSDSAEAIALREENKRLRKENADLRDEIGRQSQHILAILAQQESIRVGGLDPAALSVSNGMNPSSASML